jgi:hypothetical protein
MKENHLFTFILLSFYLSSIGHTMDLPWREESAPEIMGRDLERTFSALPLSGLINSQDKLWPGNYWPLRDGSINVRWFGIRKPRLNYQSPDQGTVRRLSTQELAQLSPAEKYDLFLGRYDYPLKKEVEKIANPKALPWEGICHGWSPASINHTEPRPKLMRNPEGIEIPFGSTDIKALLSYYYAFYHKVIDTHQMGRRCFDPRPRSKEKDCAEDLNAGAFHLILANRMGIEGKSFILDIQRGSEVWNHPIRSFQSNLIREHTRLRTPAPGTYNQLEVSSQIEVVEEDGHAWNPVLGTKKQSLRKIIYRYLLDLDSQGEVIGGVWLSNERPDFIWVMNPPAKYEGIFNRLQELLDDD